jgi:putative flippase GtrA
VTGVFGPGEQRLEEEPPVMSTESWPQPAVRLWTLAQRFQKFILVGAVGLAVNQGLLFVLHGQADARLSVASPVAIFISMVVTFLLNEHWTWHDRGSGPILHRLLAYFPINTVGLLINFGVLSVLYEDHDVHYLMANLVGAGIAAVWNFALNNVITWRD